MTADEVRRTIGQMDERTPAQGAKMVVRAWVDSAFKARLLTDAKSACAEVGVDVGTLANIVAIEKLFDRFAHADDALVGEIGRPEQALIAQ